MTMRELDRLLTRLRELGFEYDLLKPHSKYWHFSAWPTMPTEHPSYVMLRLPSKKAVAEAIKGIIMGYNLGQAKALSRK